MSDEQLKSAAHKYCELMGLDPEKPVQGQNESCDGLSCDFYWTEPTWKAVAKRLKEHWAASTAIDFALKGQ